MYCHLFMVRSVDCWKLVYKQNKCAVVADGVDDIGVHCSSTSTCSDNVVLSSVRSRMFSRSFLSGFVHLVGQLMCWNIPAGQVLLQLAGRHSPMPAKVPSIYCPIISLCSRLYVLNIGHRRQFPTGQAMTSPIFLGQRWSLPQ